MVVAPSRVRWRVGRRWLPFRVRIRRDVWRELGPDNVGDTGWFFDEPGGILAALAAAAVLLLVLFVAFPIVAIAVELVVVAVVLLGAVAGRVILRRPWTIYAVSELAEPIQEHTWRVVGWRRSRRLIDQVAESLERGHEPPPGATTIGATPMPLPR